MKRPQSHRAGELAESIVEQAFLRNNWVVNSQDSDYGFDFLVQHLEPGGGAISAFIQVKALTSKIQWKQERFTFRLEKRYLAHWNQTPEPVYLCVVEIDSSRIFVQDALKIDLPIQRSRSHETKTANISFRATSELTKTLFRHIETEVRSWWVPVQFLKATYSSLGKHPIADRQLIVRAPTPQATCSPQGADVNKLLTSEVFGLVTARGPETQQRLERYIELMHDAKHAETENERSQIAESLQDMPPLDEDEIRNLTNAAIRQSDGEFWRPPKLLEIIRELGNMGRARVVSDDDWLTWMNVSTR